MLVSVLLCVLLGRKLIRVERVCVDRARECEGHIVQRSVRNALYLIAAGVAVYCYRAGNGHSRKVEIICLAHIEGELLIFVPERFEGSRLVVYIVAGGIQIAEFVLPLEALVICALGYGDTLYCRRFERGSVLDDNLYAAARLSYGRAVKIESYLFKPV